MRRLLASAAIAAVMIAGSGPLASAQYRYPYGYSGGWNGWGGGTVAGSNARGMGVYAAGAGAYNEQTAVARSINANTAMQMNEYLYSISVNNSKIEHQRQAKRRGLVNETADVRYKRLNDNPTPEDIRSGDALNVVLEELENPAVYAQVVQRSSQPIASQLVKNIVFQYAANMISTSLDDLSSRGVPDALMVAPEFQAERTALQAVIHQAREETASPGGQVSPETLAKARIAIKALQAKVDATFEMGNPDRDKADNFLKALFGLTKMLESPDVARFLEGLNTQPTTTLGHLITFMHSFNLRFGVSKSSDQRNAYDQLYPMLRGLRDQLSNPGSASTSSPVPLKDPGRVTSFFSGMHPDSFKPQPSPFPGGAPQPPPPR